MQRILAAPALTRRLVGAARQLSTVVKYTKSHEYISVQNGVGTVGITDFAQAALGDVVFVGLPEAGATFKKGCVWGCCCAAQQAQISAARLCPPQQAGRAPATAPHFPARNTLAPPALAHPPCAAAPPLPLSSLSRRRLTCTCP